MSSFVLPTPASPSSGIFDLLLPPFFFDCHRSILFHFSSNTETFPLIMLKKRGLPLEKKECQLDDATQPIGYYGNLSRVES